MKGLKTYFTYLSRNKLFTLVNTIGLSVSLMFVLLISNLVIRQLTIDKGMKDADRIMVFYNEKFAGGHYNLGTYMQSRYPEIEDWCAVSDNFMPPQIIIDGNKQQINAFLVKKNFFDFFGFPLSTGNAKEVLTDNNSIVLTRSAANRLFGTEDVIGRTVKIDVFDDTPITITGVVQDFSNSMIPDNTEAFMPFELMSRLNKIAAIEATGMDNAGSASLFFKTIPGADLNAKRKDVENYLHDIFWIYRLGNINEAHFAPVRKFYFNETRYVTQLNQYSFEKVIIYLIIGILILLMAVSNYISMSLAQTSYRAKEMATRRLLGSSRPDIFWRLISESFLLTSAAFIIAVILAKVAEPFAMDLLQTRLDLLGDLSAVTIIGCLLLIGLLSILSGFMPATILSNYNPLDVVKGSFRRKTKTVYLRLLNILQNGITIAMLGCALYLGVQIYRMLHAPLGYTYGNVLCYTTTGDKKTQMLFLNELKKLPFVKQVSFSQGLPAEGGNSFNMYIETGDSIRNLEFQTFIADSAFIDIYHIKITEDRHTMPDGQNNYFIDEKTMKILGNAGQKDYLTSVKNNRSFRIAGQFKNFQIRTITSGQKPIRIAIVSPDEFYPWNISVEMTDGDLAAYKKETDALYARLTQSVTIQSDWYDVKIESLYHSSIQLQKILGVFTIAAFIISFLGLTAMSIYFIAQRKRDIAIRKVFGSTSLNEQLSLMKFTLVSLGYSLIIAIPLTCTGFHLLDKWLHAPFASPWWVSFIAFAAVTTVSLASVWLISRKASHENPINNLKTE